MCLVSDYWEAFADELIRLADTVGVRYFKWDAVDMYGCGVVVLFSNYNGKFHYRLQNAKLSDKTTIFGEATLTRKNGMAYLDASFEGHSAVIVFFE
ncbi:MAG: hypothetical protein ACOX63_10275 [Christensenellales bacterium]|jgi:hypothetical protein